MTRKIPRALEPAGIVLLDKPPGISSFAAIAELQRAIDVRRRAGAVDREAAARGRLVSFLTCRGLLADLRADGRA